LHSKQGIAGEINYIIDLTSKCVDIKLSGMKIISIDDVENSQLREVIIDVVNAINLIKIKFLRIKNSDYLWR